MDSNKLDLLARIVLESASRLQNQRDGNNNLATAADWYDLADELIRAADLAHDEGERLDVD